MKKRSFTLLELMAAIGLIMVLAAITYGGITYASSRAQEAKTIATMEEFMSALEAFKQDYGFYPIIDKDNAKEVDLSADGWKLFMNETKNKKNRAYMEGDLGELLDGYGQAFWYKYPGTKNSAKYDLWSLGKDKYHGIKDKTKTRPGNIDDAGKNESDDICSWKQR